MPTAAQLLFSQGFGTRRECAALVAAGALRLREQHPSDPGETVSIAEGETYWVGGQPWPYHDKALLLLHKPAGHECSARPQHHPSVLELLPPPLRRRGVQPVGRLDADSTGVLLLTDDGALIHRLTSPRQHVPKVYEVRTRHAVDEAQLHALRDGVRLRDERTPVRAAHCERSGSHALRLTLTEGKYHQVKRMVAAAGNRVEALHRCAFGGVVLPAELAPGQWIWLRSDQWF